MDRGSAVWCGGGAEGSRGWKVEVASTVNRMGLFHFVNKHLVLESLQVSLV